MKSDQFFISVIMPVYNGEEFLAEAVESIQQQNYHPLEIIIVDDGSTDNTAKIAASFGDKVSYVFQSNHGPAAARNRGLEIACGNVIVFLDADDLWPANKLELQLKPLVENPSLEVVAGYIQCMQLSGATQDKPEFEEFSDPFVCFNLGSAIFRRSIFDKIGVFDVTQQYSEDVDWFMRARESGISLVVLEQVSLFYRRHQHNMTLKKDESYVNLLRALKKSLNRRRQQHDGLVVPLQKLSYLNESTETLHNYTDCKGKD